MGNGVGVIPPKNQRDVWVTLVTEQLGKISIPMNIQIIGQ